MAAALRSAAAWATGFVGDVARASASGEMSGRVYGLPGQGEDFAAA